MNDNFDIFRDKLDYREDSSMPISSKSIDITLRKESEFKGKPLILVVDDDPLIRQALKIALEKKYELILCANGNEGIEKVNNHVFAVILDIKMEGKNGFDTFIEIKKKNVYLPIIFHSAYQDIKSPYEIINDYRPFGYVIKEGNGKELQDTLESAVNYYLQINKNFLLVEELSKSEKKYRDLVENSLDIIFSLDSEGRILTINQSVTRILKYAAKDIINKEFKDLIYKANTLNENIVKEKLNDLYNSEETISFNCELITKFGEPKEMLLKLKNLSQENSFIIFGTAYSIEEDILLRLCESEKQIYKIGNYLTHVDIISQRLSGATLKYCDLDMSMKLKLCIRELLINAMEHGNLGISFEEKSESLVNGNYIQLFSDRQKDPKNVNKKITVDYLLTPQKIEATISDEGNGFDSQKLLEKPSKESFTSTISHGRGIALAKDFFDTLKYNKIGNSVFFVKNFS